MTAAPADPSDILNTRLITMDILLPAFAEASRFAPVNLTGRSRENDLVLPRHALFLAARCWTTCSYLEIGKYVGGRDHSTVVNGVNEAAARLWSDLEPVKAQLEACDASSKYSRERKSMNHLISAAAKIVEARVPQFNADQFNLLGHGQALIDRKLMLVKEAPAKDQCAVLIRFPLNGSVLRILGYDVI